MARYFLFTLADTLTTKYFKYEFPGIFFLGARKNEANIECNFKEVIASMAEDLIEVKNAKTEDKNGNYVPMAVSLKL